MAMRFTMRAMGARPSATLLVSFTLASTLLFAEEKEKDLIVGKWEPAKEVKRVSIVLEFTKDGKLKMDISSGGQGLTLEGTYKFTDDTTMQIDLDLADKKELKKVKVVKVTKDELVLKDEGKEEEEKYKKVK
jgi:uncharacterized protein (TIGR03066 family)